MILEKKPKPQFEGTCAREGCEKGFWTTHKHQKYCSRECGSKFWADALRREDRKETCAICQGDFYTRTSNKIYCSEECKTESKSTAGAAKRMYLPPKEYYLFRLNIRAFEAWRQAHSQQERQQ